MSPKWSSPAQGRLEISGVGFVLLGLALGGVLLSSTQAAYGAQGQMATLAGWLPFGYAFAAGMVAAVNPCGILLLPSLAAYVLARPGPATGSAGGRAARALSLGLAATLGFVLLFGTAGLVIGTGGYILARVFPYGGLAVGLGLVALGTWLALTGHTLGIPAASRVQLQAHSTLRSFLWFGVAYGASSLACTLPVFLAVVGSALTSGNLLVAIGRFVGYALGMGTVLTAVLFGAVLFEAVVMRWVRAFVPLVHRLAAAFLVGAGVYILGYWSKALR